MFFEINEETYAVKFNRTGTTTFARLFIVDDDAGLLDTEIQGVATLHHKDKFVKSTGRKVALADLLFQIERPEPGSTIFPEGLNKEQRRSIWEKYFESHNK